MVTNVIKGSFPMSKVLVFEGNSYVCWKNEDIRLFLAITLENLLPSKTKTFEIEWALKHSFPCAIIK